MLDHGGGWYNTAVRDCDLWLAGACHTRPKWGAGGKLTHSTCPPSCRELSLLRRPTFDICTLVIENQGGWLHASFPHSMTCHHLRA